MTFAVRLPRASYSLAKPPDFTVTPSFGLPTAGAMMWLSQLAYEAHDRDETKVLAVLEEWKLTQKARFNRHEVGLVDTDGLIVTTPDATIVAFAGTDPWLPGIGLPISTPNRRTMTFTPDFRRV